MTEEDISQKFRLKNIERTRNSFIKEVDQNELVSNNNKTFCTTLSERFLTLVFAVTVFISFLSFACLVDLPTGIMSFTTRLNIFAIIEKI